MSASAVGGDLSFDHFCVLKKPEKIDRVVREAVIRINSQIPGWQRYHMIALKPGEYKYLFFARKGEDIVGYAMVRMMDKARKVVYLSYIAVDESHRRSGVGSGLMKIILEKFKLYHLKLDVRGGSKSIDFYKSFSSGERKVEMCHTGYFLNRDEKITILFRNTI